MLCAAAAYHTLSLIASLFLLIIMFPLKKKKTSIHDPGASCRAINAFLIFRTGAQKEAALIPASQAPHIPPSRKSRKLSRCTAAHFTP
jgi:hypothetical protein